MMYPCGCDPLNSVACPDHARLVEEAIRRGQRMTRSKYDSTIARIAGNILGGAISKVHPGGGNPPIVNQEAVQLVTAYARAIVAEVIRTEPVKE